MFIFIAIAFVFFTLGYFAASWVIKADFDRRVRNFEADPLTRFDQEMGKIRRSEAQKMRNEREERLANWDWPDRV